MDFVNRIRNCCDYLLHNNNDNSSLKVSKTTEELCESLCAVSSSFFDLQSSSNDINNNNNKDFEYLKREQDVENWLCEIEIQMIELQPYIFEQDKEVLDKIKKLKTELEEKSSIVVELNSETEKMRGYVGENVKEINDRYEKVFFFYFCFFFFII